MAALLTLIQLGESTWTLWDRFVFENNPTLAEIVEWFKKEHTLEVNMVSQGVIMLWSPFSGAAKVNSLVCGRTRLSSTLFRRKKG